MKAWLANADNIDLERLATIEENVVSKFPDFNHFEEFGYRSFLKFLTSPRHKELLVTIEQVGGLAMSQSGVIGRNIGHQVSLNSVLDFISQCGTQSSAVSQFYFLKYSKSPRCNSQNANFVNWRPNDKQPDGEKAVDRNKQNKTKILAHPS